MIKNKTFYLINLSYLKNRLNQHLISELKVFLITG